MNYTTEVEFLRAEVEKCHASMHSQIETISLLMNKNIALKEQKREWVGLTDEDFQPAVQKAMVYYGYKPEHSTLTSGAGFYELVRAIESKLREKNT